MRISPILYGGLVVLLFLGTISGFKLAGIWSVSGKITSGGEAVQPVADDVESIKGWMTLEQITSTYDVNLEELLAYFDLPADTPTSTAIKDLESEQFSVTNLRLWLESNDSAVLPEPTEPASSATPTPLITAVVVAPTPSPTEHVAADKTITGKTTFQELIDWGIPVESIQQIIGGDLPALDSIIKDYVTQRGIQFSTIKSALQVEADQTR